MKGSLRIITAFGIPVQIHWTFVFLIIYVFTSSILNNEGLDGAFLSLIFVGIIFLCVVLHELGHALMARQYGVHTRDITLLPIGGAAALDEIPASPWKEFWIAVAGPLVNVIIIAILWPIHAMIWDTGLISEDLSLALSMQSFLANIIIVNMALVFFNLIPAFPMDGGRILRALLALKFDRLDATKWAVIIGKTFAVLFGILGLFFNPFLILIAIFIFIAGTSEYKSLRYGNALKGKLVLDIVNPHFETIYNYEPLVKAMQLYSETGTRYFRVLDEFDRFYGILTHQNLLRVTQPDERFVSVSKYTFRDVKMLNANDELSKIYMRILTNSEHLFIALSNGEFIGCVDRQRLIQMIKSKQTSPKLISFPITSKKFTRIKR